MSGTGDYSRDRPHLHRPPAIGPGATLVATPARRQGRSFTPQAGCATLAVPLALKRPIPDGILLMASIFTGLTTIAGVVAATLYALGATLQIRGLRRQRVLALGTLAAVIVPGLAFHAAATYLQINTDSGVYLGFFTVASLVAWLTVLFLMLAAARLPVQNLLVLALPVGAVAALAAAFGDTGFDTLPSLAPELVVHILFSLVAYTILFMAACQSLLLAYLEHALKSRGSIRAVRLLPPLESMEALLFGLLWTGIITLTVAIGTGFLFLEDLFAQQVVHHTVLALASWGVYATLLAGRHFFGWRSRTATYWTLIAFSLLVLGYFGSKFVIEIILDGAGS